MYPVEKRREAVAFCVLNGLSAGAGARVLGWPSRRSLYRWMADAGVPGARERRARAPREEDVVAEDADRRTPGELGAECARLREEVRLLELRVAVLRATAEALGKGRGADPNRMTNAEKARVAESLRGGAWTLREILSELGLARSSHQYRLRAAPARDRDAWLRPLVAEAFAAGRGAYGCRRVRLALAASGVAVSERRVARVMREEGLVARRQRRRRAYSSYAGELGEAPPNLVGRDFAAGLPNFLWLTDVTQFSIAAGKLWLCAIVDCFDGRAVAWSISRSPDAEMANSALEAAVATLAPGEAPWVHSDRGCHHRWPGWVAICESRGLTRSMSAKGCSPDNAAMEGFFGRLKTEAFYGEDWSGATLGDLERAVDGWIRWHNESRIKASLGGMSPDQFRRSLGLAA